MFKSTLPGLLPQPSAKQRRAQEPAPDGLYFTDKAQISGPRGLIVPRNATRLPLAIHCFGTGVLVWRLVLQQSRKTTF